MLGGRPTTFSEMCRRHSHFYQGFTREELQDHWQMLQLVETPSAEKVGQVRACSLCYHKHIVADLTERKTRSSNAEDAGDTPIGAPPNTTGQPQDTNAEIEWPIISVEMSSKWRVCEMEHAVKTSDGMYEHELLPRAVSEGDSLVVQEENRIQYVAGVTQLGNGSGAMFKVVFDAESSLVSVQAHKGGSGYEVGDVICLTVEGARLILTLTAEDLIWNATKEVLFYLDCRHTRLVRWSGLQDAGRIVFSMRPKVAID